MNRSKTLEVMARAIAPLAWKALGLCDTLAQENRRKASLRHAEAALTAYESHLHASKMAVVPSPPPPAAKPPQEDPDPPFTMKRSAS